MGEGVESCLGAEEGLGADMKPGPKPRVPLCHPLAPHFALGVCAPCYYRLTRRKAMVRNAHLKGRYRITMKEKNRLRRKQGDRCAICAGPWTSKGPSVDHDHLTGKRRELLCQPCNMGLGAFRDNPTVCFQAAYYLKKWS